MGQHLSEPNLITIVQEFCKRKALPIPATVSGAQDELTQQIWGLLNEGVEDIADRYNLQQLQTKLSFTHQGGADYLALDFGAQLVGLGYPDWKFLIPDTLWDSTGRIPVEGPLTPKEWQVLTTMLSARAVYSYTLMDNGIYIFGVPSPLGSVTFTAYYQSKYPCYEPGTDTFAAGNAPYFLTDGTVPRIPAYLVRADLKWRFAKEKGLPYAEDQRVAESMLANAVGRQGQGTLVMDQGDWQGRFVGPGIIVPAGSWNL